MRYVLIDHFVELEENRRAVAVKTFSPEEEFLKDHFPGMPLIPGALITEAMSQTAGWLIARSIDFDRWPLLNMIGNAKFRSFVRPGEEIQLIAEIESLELDVVSVRTEARVDGRRVAEARLFFHLFRFEADQEMEGWLRSTFEKLAPSEAGTP
jgi:3-hydroxyacyl-[acyl-carrier-protein] dehydratase